MWKIEDVEAVEERFRASGLLRLPRSVANAPLHGGTLVCLLVERLIPYFLLGLRYLTTDPSWSWHGGSVWNRRHHFSSTELGMTKPDTVNLVIQR